MPTALERFFPGARLPRIALGSWPAPLRPLAADIGDHRLVLLDDGVAGDRYGGNKVRKLEYLLGQARADGVSDLLTVGAGGSHHVLATALYGAAHGFRTHAVLVPQAATDHARANLSVSAAHCASSTVAPHAVLAPVAVLAVAARIRRETGRWPRLIPAGGSDAIGTLGWVGAGLELAEAVRAGALPAPDRLYVSFGSGGTAAGLLLGLRLAGLSTEVVAVRVTGIPLVAGALVRRLATRAARHLAASGADLPGYRLDGLRMLHDWYAPGYGRGDSRITDAIAEGRAHGLHLDVTYTGKAYAAALSDLRAIADREPLTAVLVHTLDSRGTAGLPSVDTAHVAKALIP